MLKYNITNIQDFKRDLPLGKLDAVALLCDRSGAADPGTQQVECG
jgi:hypothetical protein